MAATRRGLDRAAKPGIWWGHGLVSWPFACWNCADADPGLAPQPHFCSAGLAAKRAGWTVAHGCQFPADRWPTTSWTSARHVRLRHLRGRNQYRIVLQQWQTPTRAFSSTRLKPEQLIAGSILTSPLSGIAAGRMNTIGAGVTTAPTHETVSPPAQPAHQRIHGLGAFLLMYERGQSRGAFPVLGKAQLGVWFLGDCRAGGGRLVLSFLDDFLLSTLPECCRAGPDLFEVVFREVVNCASADHHLRRYR